MSLDMTYVGMFQENHVLFNNHNDESMKYKENWMEVIYRKHNLLGMKYTFHRILSNRHKAVIQSYKKICSSDVIICICLLFKQHLKVTTLLEFNFSYYKSLTVQTTRDILLRRIKHKSLEYLGNWGAKIKIARLTSTAINILSSLI